MVPPPQGLVLLSMDQPLEMNIEQLKRAKDSKAVRWVLQPSVKFSCGHFHVPPGVIEINFLISVAPYWFQLPAPKLLVLWYIAKNVADEPQRL